MKILINGCFDCFHNGHEQLIQYALDLFSEIDSSQEFLILLNSDDSYEKLKSIKILDSFNERKRNIEAFLLKKRLDDWWKIEENWPSIRIESFNSEKELKELIDNFKPTFVLKGHDYSNLTKVVGYPNWPILIKPRGKDKEGKDISSTKIKEKKLSCSSLAELILKDSKEIIIPSLDLTFKKEKQ